MFIELTTVHGPRIFNMDHVMEIMPVDKDNPRGCRIIYAFTFQDDYACTDVEENYSEILKKLNL